MAKEDSYEQLLAEAKKLHGDGIDGNLKAAALANEKLARLLASNPGRAVVHAYYGSSLALLARDATHPLKKEEKAQESLNALDRAVQLDPNDKEIRLLRANVCMRLPDNYFQTMQKAVTDFEFLLARQKADPRYLSTKQLKDVLNHLMTAYRNTGKQDKANEIKLRLSKLN